MTQFIAAVVVQFIRDAALKPTQEEADAGRNLNADSQAAIDYLFAAGSKFEDHVEIVGGSAAPFRQALLSSRPLDDRSSFTPMQRRILQARYRWWIADPFSAPAFQPTEGTP